MGTEQAQTLTQVNQEFQQTRVNRLDAAISQALTSRLPPAPKGKGTVAAAPSTSAGTPIAATVPASSSSAAPTEASVADPFAVDPGVAALALEAVPVDTADGSDSQAQDGAAEALEPGFDREAVSAAATKKDLRAVEKLLGLDEGVLGATNADYAAYRRRCEAADDRDKALDQKQIQNNDILIRKYGPVADLVTHASKGDLIAYGRTIEQTTGVPIQVFIEHWVKNVRQLPQETLQLQRRLAQYETPDGRPLVTQTPADKALPAPVDKTAAETKANTYLTTEAANHPAFKLKGGIDEVRAAWLKSYDKASKAFKLTPKAAADQVVAARKAAYEQEQWVLSGRTPPAKPRTRTLSRTGASEAGGAPRGPAKTRDQLIQEGAENIRRQKQADAVRSRR